MRRATGSISRAAVTRGYAAVSGYISVLLLKSLALLPLSWVRLLGALIGSLAWWTGGRAVNTTLTNLALCYPEMRETQRRQLAKQSLRETAKTALEAALIWHKPWAWLERHIVAREGEDILRAKLAEGRGVLVMSPHLGNWELLAPYLVSIAPLTAMYQPLKNPQLDQMVRSGRERSQTQMAPTNRQGVRQLLKALDAGGIVIVLPDQVPDKGAGQAVSPFFNQPALTMTLVQGILQRTGCALCCCYAERVVAGFKIVVMEAAAEICTADLQQSLRALNASMESCVRRVPEQYQWEYKRFRSLPPPYRKPY